jgi:2,4-dienoyl-CoA reductase-like NADH-dependent reductase (Old Yellow Enzyme family)
MIKASEWRFVTDKDNSLMTAFSRVFAKEIRLAEAHHFICMVDRAKSLKQCNQEFKDGRADLLRWGNAMMHDTRSIWQLAYLYLIDEFNRKQFHEGEKRTPAQRLGITNKIYNVNDILYLR